MLSKSSSNFPFIFHFFQSESCQITILSQDLYFDIQLKLEDLLKFSGDFASSFFLDLVTSSAELLNRHFTLYWKTNNWSTPFSLCHFLWISKMNRAKEFSAQEAHRTLTKLKKKKEFAEALDLLMETLIFTHEFSVIVSFRSELLSEIRDPLESNNRVSNLEGHVY